MWLDHGGQKRGLDDVAKNVKVERGNVAWTSRPQQQSNPIVLSGNLSGTFFYSWSPLVALNQHSE
jgi:hypothetical protein